MQLMRRQAVVLASAVAVFGLGACSGDEPTAATLAQNSAPGLSPGAGTAGSTAGNADNSSGTTEQNTTGFESYTYLGAFERTVIYRIDLDVSECLSGKGYQWEPEPNEDQGAFATMVTDMLRPPTMEEIQQFGYGYKVGRLQRLNDEFADDEAELSPQLLDAKEACTTEVVSGSPYERWLTLSGQVQDVVVDATDRVHASPDFIAVEKEWSNCVAQAGYPMTHLDDGVDVEWPSDDDPRAIEMAVSDYQCRFDVGIFDVEARLLNAEATAWREANPGVVEEMDALRDELATYAGG